MTGTMGLMTSHQPPPPPLDGKIRILKICNSCLTFFLNYFSTNWVVVKLRRCRESSAVTCWYHWDIGRDYEGGLHTNWWQICQTELNIWNVRQCLVVASRPHVSRSSQLRNGLGETLSLQAGHLAVMCRIVFNVRIRLQLESPRIIYVASFPPGLYEVLTVTVVSRLADVDRVALEMVQSIRDLSDWKLSGIGRSVWLLNILISSHSSPRWRPPWRSQSLTAWGRAWTSPGHCTEDISEDISDLHSASPLTWVAASCQTSW